MARKKFEISPPKVTETAAQRIKNASKRAKLATAVYSYVRFSTPEQRKGGGEARQTDLASKWCEDFGYALLPANRYADLGLSAYKGANLSPDAMLGRFLMAVREGRIVPGSILLVESLDRLSRDDINKALELFLSIINAGIVVVTLCDGAVYRADANPHELMAQMMISLAIFVRANDESRMKSQRKADAWERKREVAKKGEYHGGRLPSWIALDKDGKYKVVESEASTVRDFFDRYTKGEGVHVLARELKRPKATIMSWLVSKTVLGTLTMIHEGKPVEYEGHYPEVIKKDQYEHAQLRRGERLVGGARGSAEFINLFQGLLHYKNKTLIVQTAKDNGRKLYVGEGCCLAVSAVERHLCSNILYERLVEKRVEMVESPESADRLAALEAKIKEVQTEINSDVSLFSTLLPVLKKVKADRDAAKAATTKIVYESRDPDAVTNCIGESAGADDKERRLRLREMIRDTVVRIDIDRIEGDRRRYVAGRMKLTDTSTIPFAFAYSVRVPGRVVSCDGSGVDPRTSKVVKDAASVLPVPIKENEMNERVLAEIKKIERASKKYLKSEKKRIEAVAKTMDKQAAQRRRPTRKTATA